MRLASKQMVALKRFCWLYWESVCHETSIGFLVILWRGFQHNQENVKKHPRTPRKSRNRQKILTSVQEESWRTLTSSAIRKIIERFDNEKSLKTRTASRSQTVIYARTDGLAGVASHQSSSRPVSTVTIAEADVNVGGMIVDTRLRGCTFAKNSKPAALTGCDG